MSRRRLMAIALLCAAWLYLPGTMFVTASAADESKPLPNAAGGDDAAAASDCNREEKDADQPAAVRPFEDIAVYPEARRVEIRSWTCLEAGYLEQVACSAGTREHESLVVIRAKPSNIHAALLMAGFESGRPGRWEFDPETQEVSLIQPRGDKLDVWFAYERDGKRIVESARSWIRDHHEKQTFPDTPWIFGGSMFKPNPEWMGPGEHYVADMTGSIIGLVTFGDETIGLKQVLSDQAAIHEPEWMVFADRVPEEGTEVTVILLPFGERPDGAEWGDDDGEKNEDDDAPAKDQPSTRNDGADDERAS